MVLTVILNCVCCVSFAGVMFDANTLGMSWSFMVNVVVMVLLMLLVVPWLMAMPVGLRLSICGALWSFMVNVVVMVLLMLLLVSFASMVSV